MVFGWHGSPSPLSIFRVDYCTPRGGLTLHAALLAAGQNNRLVKAARLQIDEANGDLIGASLRLINNPELAGTLGQRRPGTSSSRATPHLEFGLEQRFEMGGQRGHRIARARADLLTVTASTLEVQRVVEFGVARTFYEGVVAARRQDLLQQNARLARDLYDVADRRLEAGESNPLELNTARIRLAEVERRALAARATLDVSTVRLAALLGLPPDTPLRLQGDLPDDEDAPEADALVASALQVRPDLASVTHQVDAADASIGLADAVARPDVAVGVFYGREEGDDILTAALRVPIPLFNRNQGERARTRATRARLVAEQSAVRLRIESEVRQALLVYEQTRRALQVYSADVLRAQAESADLLQRAFEAGEVGIQDVIVLQRELLEGQEGYLEASLDFTLARAGVLAGAYLSQSGRLEGVTP